MVFLKLAKVDTEKKIVLDAEQLAELRGGRLVNITSTKSNQPTRVATRTTETTGARTAKELGSRVKVETSTKEFYETRLQQIIDGATRAGVLKTEADFVVNGQEGSDKIAAKAYSEYVNNIKASVRLNFKQSPQDFSEVLTHLYVFAHGNEKLGEKPFIPAEELRVQTDKLLTRYSDWAKLHRDLEHISYELRNNGVDSAKKDFNDLMNGKKLIYIARAN